MGNRFLAGHIAIVVAHPDDETIGCGALLGRLAGVCVVLVTDGAPRNLADARRHGFATAEAYAAKRLSELREALRLAHVAPNCFISLGVPDQEAALRLPELTRRLVEIFTKRRTRLVITHAYEGGHPDHDATACAVHLAARLVWRRRAIDLVEMPYYRLGDAGLVFQSFIPGNHSECQIPLSADEIVVKRRMIAAHATQKEVLAPFSATHELFRASAGYDFSVPPNNGRLYYEHHDWGMDGSRWCALAAAATREISGEASACP